MQHVSLPRRIPIIPSCSFLVLSLTSDKTYILLSQLSPHNGQTRFCNLRFSRHTKGFTVVWCFIFPGLLILLIYNRCTKPAHHWCFRPRFCTVRLYWDGTTCANEMNLLRILSLVQDRSLDLLTSSSARYHWAMDAPTKLHLICIKHESY